MTCRLVEDPQDAGGNLQAHNVGNNAVISIADCNWMVAPWKTCVILWQEEKIAEIEGSVGFRASRQVNNKAQQCWGDNINEIAVDAELNSIRTRARGPSFGGNPDDTIVKRWIVGTNFL